ncbi:MAG: LuxR family transcriptional regulator [Kofleriaceae bacterium]|jgi:DNA-binding CsgD family transcriptional regulator|nr:LuxR family transcriptional regulator [Kofleriaceae bacterium]MBP6837327.1 LuxR family transcriptional regulator [Kofleriaceae bacterium]MBP9207427.1 LuxR family transcriptional regulator [Kofleriaceae bacterium]
MAGVALAFVAVAVLAALDLGADLGEGTSVGHALAEGGVVVVGLVGAWLVTRQLRRMVRDAQALRAEAAVMAADLHRSQAEAMRWRGEVADLLGGLSQAIDRQLERWALSPAEKEVALLLLKGLSHKELADVRGVTEATARQQARAVYKKAGLTGRNDLAAFFLEDLLAPASPGGASVIPKA